MLAPQIDQELSELGPVPADVRAIVTRVLGDLADKGLSLADADALLASLGASLDDKVGAPAANLTTVEPLAAASQSPAPLESEPAPDARAASEVPAASEPPAPGVASAWSEPLSAPTPAPAAPQLTAAERRRAEFAAAMLDSAAPPPLDAPPADSDLDDAHASALSQAFEGDTDLSEPPPRGPSGAPPAERRLEGEATAQAIVAAFDDPDFDAEVLRRRLTEDDPSIAFDSSPAAATEPPLPAALELGNRGRRGARRPDLDRLLDQPLDALDFERSEPVANPANRSVKSSDAPDAAQQANANDDFEILVDDEILEIAEDEVELVDEDSSS